MRLIETGEIKEKEKMSYMIYNKRFTSLPHSSFCHQIRYFLQARIRFKEQGPMIYEIKAQLLLYQKQSGP